MVNERKIRFSEREVKLVDWVDADKGRSAEVIAEQLTALRRELYGDSQTDIKRSTIYKAMDRNDVRLFVNKRGKIRWVQCIKPVFGFKGQIMSLDNQKFTGKTLSNVPYYIQDLNRKLDRIESKLDKLLDKLLDKPGTDKRPGQREASGVLNGYRDYYRW